MKHLQLEYRIEKSIAFELEVEDEIYAKFLATKDTDLLDLNWPGIHEECENAEEESDYSINDAEHDYAVLIPWCD